MSRPFIVLLAIACTMHGLAHAGGDAQLCRNGSFAAQESAFALAKVAGTSRSYLRSDLPPCPNDSAACRGRGYVVPGDTVLTGATSAAYVCVLFPGRHGGSAGYVRQDEILPQPVATNVPLSNWAGDWRDGDNRIVMRVVGTRLTASGNAYWPSANPSLKERPGGPNLGEMSGSAIPVGNRAVFAGDDSADCRVTLTLLLPFLLAADNSRCGGMNVSFTGVYQRP